MTALKKYSRLEASGVWLESPESEPIEVLVSLGKASLILYNYEDTPLTHWSLSSIKLVSQIDTEGIFSTTEEGLETLKIDDIYMVDALLNFINNPKEKRVTPRLSNKLFISR